MGQACMLGSWAYTDPAGLGWAGEGVNPMVLPLHTGTLSPPWQVMNDTNRDEVGA